MAHRGAGAGRRARRRPKRDPPHYSGDHGGSSRRGDVRPWRRKVAARGRGQRETTWDGNQDDANDQRRPSGPLRACLKRRTSGIRREAGRSYGRTRANGSTRTTEIAAEDPSTGRTSLRGGEREGRIEADGSNRQRAGMRITEDRFLTGRNLSPFNQIWHVPVDVQLGGGGCREEFRP